MTIDLRTNKKYITINVNKMIRTLARWLAIGIIVGAVSWAAVSWLCLMFHPIGAEVADWNFFNVALNLLESFR